MRKLTTFSLAGAIVSGTLLPSLALGGVASATTPPENTNATSTCADTRKPAGRSGDETYEVKELILARNSHDGVKGKIKNFSNDTIKVTDVRIDKFGDRITKYAIVPPGGDVTYYDSSRRDGESLDGVGIKLWIQSVDRPYLSTVYLTITDPLIGRPDTRYEFYPLENVRKGWSTGEAHHEIFGNHRTWIKREDDGWDGGHETDKTSDWAVFTVHIDNMG